MLHVFLCEWHTTVSLSKSIRTNERPKLRPAWLVELLDLLVENQLSAMVGFGKDCRDKLTNWFAPPSLDESGLKAS